MSLLKICLLLLLAFQPEARAQIKITPMRDSSWGLHESVRREVYAAVDRGRDFLAARQLNSGLWEDVGDGETCFPGLALLGDDTTPAVSLALQQALKGAAIMADRSLAQPDQPRQREELVWAATLFYLAGTEAELNGRILRRLQITRRSSLSPGAEATLAEIREYNRSGDPRTDWNRVLAATLRIDPPTPGTVALAALARLRRDRPDLPEQALLAHLRWLTAHWPTEPGDIWFMAGLLEELSPAIIHTAGAPLNWRQRLTESLIAHQRRDPATGAGYWAGSSTDLSGDRAAVIRNTALAVTTLHMLSQQD